MVRQSYQPLLLVVCLLVTQLYATLPYLYIPPGTPDPLIQLFDSAWTDCLTLVRMVAATFSDCDPAFTRYFEGASAPLVKHVFQTIANMPLDSTMDPNNVRQYLSSSNVIGLQPKFALLTVSLGDGAPQIGAAQRPCDGTPPPWAFLKSSKSRNEATLCMCTRSFGYPNLNEILNPPSWGLDEQGDPLPGFGCDGLGDHDTEWMLFPGAIILHELVHWSYLLEDIPEWRQWINTDQWGGKTIEDYEGTDPPDGLGPYNAHRLNSNYGINPTAFVPHAPANNADSYVYYALSKFFSWTCGKPFGTSYDPNDNSVREPRPGYPKGGAEMPPMPPIP